MAEEKTSTKKRNTRRKRTSTKQQTKSQGFSLRSEVKGLIVIAFAVISLLGFFGFELGLVGQILTGIFRYGFGLGGIIPCLGVFWIGWRLLYKGTFISVTKRGVVMTLFFLFLLALVPLWRVPEGQELITTQLADQGGVVGGAIATFLRTLLGELGAIILDVFLLLAFGILITRLSLRSGLQKAADKTQVGLDVAKEVAAEKVAVAKEVFEDWNEQRKEAAEQRKAYNREKDTRFADAADQALDTLEKRGITTDRDNFETSAVIDNEPMVDTVTTVESPKAPTSWKELAEIEARNRAAEQLSNISKDAGDAKSYDADDFDQFSDASRSTGDDYVYTPDEDYTYTPDEGYTDESESVENNHEEQPEFTYQNTTIGSLETNHAAIASAVPGTGAAASSVSAGVGMSGMSLQVPSTISTTEDTAQVAVSKDGQIHRTYDRPYHFPSLDILAKGKGSQSNGEEVAQNAMMLENVLSNFGITAKVVNATQGPTVTRYEIEPAPGVKVSRIVNLTDDIALNLAAQHIRMEAPIPGKSAIGIEVPNKTTEAVHLRDVLDCSDFKDARGGIPVGLGKDIAGKPVITDLAKMPHLLVAGTTGSGKSVCVNTLISSILFSRKPEEVKLLLIDPKMVELSIYNGIPHLMAPVVTDMKKAAAVLRWAVREMEARYKAFAASGKRDIKSYNEAHPKAAMPLIVLIIDELADLMMTAPDDIEESISRLAQMARAAGIHMVLATQRPSVNVITGSIKANVPSRISFAVGSQIDSRTILDMAGAEKLLGKGDMLFAPIGANKPIRVQGAFISDDEVEHLVEFVKAQREPEYDDTVTQEAEKETEKESSEENDIYRDELLERAVNLVMESGQASVSMLQRRFRIGYTRAARLVDTMEDLKIVGPSMGSKAREILMSPEQAKARYFSDSNDEQ
ncbi:DNA translocase FtsK 4TM domain-containing protein [Veillonella nakazawae]|uniref:FtsK/SpoIIIE family DNA translocase n=1 Tax=Veillonella TaxID=29465 RepID=UPI000E5C8AFF|nr:MULTISPECIES: DNA translocase FtsK [unclassified Veillonella]MDU1410167.1 DNA translocase FtsK 4TM domain-containing protein [Veillonella sp.]MDU2555618.1 DNA translocase FtsK 4TM domain-containing protein [Veillonella sp.]MDU2568980.1 DNA translocase FtsK 4TM domain-containing protein [Veillonella sp.]MDU2576058.1 DNA translocase FtsK 4TM domain-containing protein [Veillonella sp.]MDU5865224.1 DNA translocase FtsK 4TM domain-containing protein [Veillonella sp.]